MANDVPDLDGRALLLLATPGFEDALVAELPAALEPARLDRWPGLVAARAPETGTPPLDPIFARQQLPAATEIRASAVAPLAEGVYRAAAEALDRGAGAGGRFTVHAFTLVGAEPGLGSRAGLVAREALSRLRERRRRAHRRYVTPEDAAASPGEVGLLVQVLMVARDRAWISVAAPRPLPHGGFDLSPWPGGAPAIARDRAPPSRAYRKLEEAFLWMGQAPGPGELCVDLGAAPGGWSAAALARGARVVAVDRAPLAPSLAGHPHLTLVRGSAFAFEPPRPADWLLTDVICEPERTVALIQRWVTRRWCRKVVASIKLKGRGGDRLLGEARAALEACGWGHVRIKHLHHNKNEVTVMMMAGERG